MCEACRWSEWTDVLDEMMSDSRFDFARDTVGGIEDFVKDAGHITDRQKQALVNIWRSAMDDDGDWQELFEEVA